MARFLISATAFLLGTLTLAGWSGAVETVKLRPVGAIYVDGKGAALKQPEGVGCDGKAALIVADTGNGRLLQYRISEGKIVAAGEIALQQVPYPIRPQVNSKGDIFVLDGKLRRIARISADGMFQDYVALGANIAGSVIPKSIRIDRKDNLYILDVFSARVLVIDPAGMVQREIPLPKEYGFISDIAVDSNGRVLLVDSVGKRVFVVPRDSSSPELLVDSAKVKEDVHFPTAIAADVKGYIFLVDQHGNGIVILGDDGTLRGRQLSHGWKEGYLRYPSQICVNEDGHVFIANRENNRIEVLSIAR